MELCSQNEQSNFLLASEYASKATKCLDYATNDTCDPNALKTISLLMNHYKTKSRFLNKMDAFKIGKLTKCFLMLFQRIQVHFEKILYHHQRIYIYTSCFIICLLHLGNRFMNIWFKRQILKS